MVSKRVQSIKPSGIREIFEMATKDAINLGLGELDFEPPVEVREAFKEALDQDRNRYGPTKGIDELRAPVARKVQQYRSDVTLEKCDHHRLGDRGDHGHVPDSLRSRR